MSETFIDPKYGHQGSFDGYDPPVDFKKVRAYVDWKTSWLRPWVGSGLWMIEPKLNRIEKIRAGLLLRQEHHARCFHCAEWSVG